MPKAVAAVLVLVICNLCLVAVALGDDSHKDDAKKHFDAGNGLLKVEEFTAAAAEFEESVRLFPTKNGLFNLANAYKGMGRYDKSLKTYERLRLEFGKQLDSEMQKKVDEDVQDMSAMRAWLVLQVDQPGATIEIDGMNYGKTPSMEALVLGAGTHSMTLSKDGFKPDTRDVKLLAGDRKIISVKLAIEQEVTVAPGPSEPDIVEDDPGQDLEPDKVPAPTEEAGKEGRTGLYKGGVAVTVIGAVAVLGGTLTGITALSIGSELEKECPGGVCTSEKKDQLDGMNKQAIASDVLLGVGGAAMVAGIVMLIVDKKRGREDSSSDITISPVAGPTLGGAAITGRF